MLATCRERASLWVRVCAVGWQIGSSRGCADFGHLPHCESSKVDNATHTTVKVDTANTQLLES
eukprot:651050-Rhodomonas_salina.1